MGKRSQQFKRDDLARFLIYILAHRPDEFGLVPDEEGFVPFKELLQAIHEEPGWGYVRQSHINEVLMGRHRDTFESEGKRLRAVTRKWRHATESAGTLPPKVLFSPIRRKAHRVVMEKGLRSAGDRPVILSSQKEMARRIGVRRDQEPVLLEILAAAAADKGIHLIPFGDLFLTSEIPPQFIAGPPVSDEGMESGRDKVMKKDTPLPIEVATRGLLLDPDRDPHLRRTAKGKKRRGWKEEARKLRRNKRG